MITKKVYLILILSLFWLIITPSIYAQKLISQKKFTESSDNIVDFYDNSETNEIIRVFSNETNSGVVNKGHYKGLQIKNYQCGLVFESGKRIALPSNENILNIKGNYFVTQKTDLNEYISEIKTYKITGVNIELLGSKNINPEQNIYLVSNGNVLITDEYELYGTTIELYSNSLNLIKSYKPFETGFENVVFGDNGNIIQFVIHPTFNNYQERNSNNIKIIIADSKTGNIIIENEINISDFRTSFIFSLKESFIIYGFSKLIALNNSGKIIWERTLTLSDFSLAGSEKNKMLYVCTENNLICLDLINGNSIWEKNISSFYQTALIEKPSDLPNIIIRPIAIKILNEDTNVGLLIGQSNKGTLLQQYPKYNTILFVFDKEGNLIKTSNSIQKTKIIKLISNINDFKLINDNNINIYEKTK